VMYINSPGGSFTAMTAIYDTMQYVSPQIQTVVLGQAASAAAVLLAAGTPGKRLALPNARVLIHQPAMGEAGHGQASDIEIQAAEIMRMRTWLEETLAKHTDKSAAEINRDIDRDKILSAEDAKAYGIVDQVLTSRKRVGAMTDDLARYVDHTLLKPEATAADVEALIAEASELGVYSVCVSPSMLPVELPEGL